VVLTSRTELDALGLEEEDEGPSYLSELNKAPDFVDEAPVEEVCDASFSLIGTDAHMNLQSANKEAVRASS
jgi:hypothetical protein